MARPLSEKEVTRILSTLPSSKDRLDMFVHLSVVKGWETPPTENLHALETVLKEQPTTPTRSVEDNDPHHPIPWTDARGRIWTAERVMDTSGDKCHWLLLDPRGTVVQMGLTESGKDEAALRDNARKAARRAFQKVAPQ